MDIEKMSLAELKALAKEQGIKGYSTMKKNELAAALNDVQASAKAELKRAAAKTSEKNTDTKNTKTESKKKAAPTQGADAKDAVKSAGATERRGRKTAPAKEAAAAPEGRKPAQEKAAVPDGKRPAKEAAVAAEGKRPAKETAATPEGRKPAQEAAAAAEGRKPVQNAPARQVTRVESKTAPSSTADGIVPHNYESAGGTGFTRPAQNEQRSNASSGEAQPGQGAPRQARGEQRYQRPLSDESVPQNARLTQYGQRLQRATGEAGQPAQGSRPVQQNPDRRPAPTNQTSSAVSGRIVSTGRITPEEREALDPGISPEIEQLDSGETKTGILEIVDSGYGFIRCDNFLPGENDVYVSPAQIRKFNLKTGDIIEGNTKIRTSTEKFSALLYIKTINGFHPTEAVKRCRFEDMTPIFPHTRLHLETPGCSPAMRIVDLLSPIGKGQRGMIVSQPKAGKTTLLKQIASAWKTIYPDLHIIILLIDERPEEVTDMKESIQGPNVEVIYSTFDELPENHKRVSEMAIERAKRLVEHKKDVVILLDSITRLARAYNLTVSPSGRTLSGGLDPAALHMPKKFFGSARCMREGGSLTILATALVETGSRMDDVVFEEFKGTGNMELVLDRNLSERRIFPAIDLPRSSTRREDLLLTPEEVEANNIIRRAFNSGRSEDASERIINMFAHTRSNREFIELVKRTKL